MTTPAQPLGLTRHQLDFMRCAQPGCGCASGPLSLLPRCHPAAASHAVYLRGGALSLRCAECGRETWRLAVAVCEGPAAGEG
ncbi:MAG: hypothetical protein KGK07_16190 [Chloroflexota bacterium]|nr:hypothetical protein [Chloroflexota bacterium]